MAPSGPSPRHMTCDAYATQYLVARAPLPSPSRYHCDICALNIDARAGEMGIEIEARREGSWPWPRRKNSRRRATQLGVEPSYLTAVLEAGYRARAR